MFKSLNREHTLKVINQWIRDGSTLESWGSYQDAEWVVLRGRYGIREEIYIFYAEDAYREHGYEPLEESGVRAGQSDRFRLH